jgi:hypothetical protein
MPIFQSTELTSVQSAITDFRTWLDFNVTKYLDIAGLGNRDLPSEWARLKDQLDQLYSESVTTSPPGSRECSCQITDELLPLLKRALIVKRRQEADRIQRLQDRALHLEILGALDSEMKAIDCITTQKWFRETVPQRIPCANDVLPMQLIEKHLGNDLQLLPRKYDEKFHALQAPELFLPDLGYYRALTDLRGTGTAVAFLDIDNFKTFNRAYTETRVDRNLLPRFMQLLEAHMHFHGHAYRNRPVPERTQRASYSSGGLGGAGSEDGLTGCVLVGPKLMRVTPLG